MAVIETWIKTDLKSIVKVTPLSGILFSQDNMANLIGVELLDGGEPAAVSGSVSANVLRANGTTVAVAGTLSGNRASITLPQAAYAYPGMVAIVIKLTSDSVVTTIGAIQAVVYRSSTDTIVDPGTIIPSISTLIAAIDAAVDSIPPDYSALTAEVGDLKNAFDAVLNGTNLFDSTTTTDGQRLNGSGGLNAYASGFVSAYIPVKPGMSYINNFSVLDTYHRVAIYNSSKTFLSNQIFSQNIVEIPSSGAFVRFCALLTEKDTTTFVLLSANDYVLRDQICDTSTPTANLLTGTTWSSGYISKTDGTLKSNSSYTTTDYIAVEGGNYVISSQNNQRKEIWALAVYDSGKTVIPAANETGEGTQQDTGYFHLPDNAGYVRFTYRVAEYSANIFIGQYELNIGYEQINYPVIKDRALLPAYEKIEESLRSKWYGKTMLSIGDSQTYNNRWQPFVSSYLGMASLVQGFSGYTVAVSNPNNAGYCISSNYILGQIDTYLEDKDFDVVLVMGGTNDWGYDGVRHEGYANIQIGENTDTTNTTFKGAVKAIVSHFQKLYPGKEVVLMSNIGGRSIDNGEETPQTDMTAPLTNANGYTQATFATAMREIAEWLGVAFIDVFDCGITIYNTAYYLSDGLHINATTGAKKVADKVISGLLNIQPYVS